VHLGSILLLQRQVPEPKGGKCWETHYSRYQRSPLIVYNQRRKFQSDIFQNKFIFTEIKLNSKRISVYISLMHRRICHLTRHKGPKYWLVDCILQDSSYSAGNNINLVWAPQHISILVHVNLDESKKKSLIDPEM